MDPRCELEVIWIEAAIKWFNFRTTIGLTDEDVIYKHDRITKCFRLLGGSQDVREAIALNDRMKAIMLSVIRRESFQIWDIHLKWDESPPLDKFMRMLPWKNAMNPNFLTPGLAGSMQGNYPPGLGKDISDPNLKDSYLAADSPMTLCNRVYESYIIPDSVQIVANQESLKVIHDRYKKDAHYMPMIKKMTAKHLKDTREVNNAFVTEYVKVQTPTTTIVRSSSSEDVRQSEGQVHDPPSPQVGDPGSLIQSPAPVASSSRQARRKSDTRKKSTTNYGQLFFDQDHQHIMFLCLRDDKDRKLKGHKSRDILIGKSRVEYVQEAKAQFEQSLAIDQDFISAMVELSAYCKVKRIESGMVAHRVNMDGSSGNKNFWDHDEVFEQLGKEYLKAAKLAAVVKHPITNEEIVMNYDLWRRYKEDLLEHSCQGKKKFSCLNHCVGFQDVIREELEDHYEFQLVMAFICTIESCGAQISYSKGFGAHVSKVHVKTDEKLKNQIDSRCHELRNMNTKSIFGSIDSRILFGARGFEVSAKYKPPNLEQISQISNRDVQEVTLSSDSEADSDSPVTGRLNFNVGTIKTESDDDANEEPIAPAAQAYDDLVFDDE